VPIQILPSWNARRSEIAGLRCLLRPPRLHGPKEVAQRAAELAVQVGGAASLARRRAGGAGRRGHVRPGATRRLSTLTAASLIVLPLASLVVLGLPASLIVLPPTSFVVLGLPASLVVIPLASFVVLGLPASLVVILPASLIVLPLASLAILGLLASLVVLGLPASLIVLPPTSLVVLLLASLIVLPAATIVILGLLVSLVVTTGCRRAFIIPGSPARSVAAHVRPAVGPVRAV